MFQMSVFLKTKIIFENWRSYFDVNITLMNALLEMALLVRIILPGREIDVWLCSKKISNFFYWLSVLINYII